MKYMIHACPKRMWYVGDYLIPSMLAQGIDKGNIIVWNDIDGVGNLASCLASFASCQEEGETWHLQDDVVICHDFAERTASAPKGVVCGFCVGRYEDATAGISSPPSPTGQAEAGSVTLQNASSPSGHPHR